MTSKKSPNPQTIKQFEDQIKTLNESWKRALADYQNLAKRVEKERLDAIIYATGSLLSKFLKIADDLWLAVTHHQDQPWLKLIHADLSRILKDEGLTEINAAGLPFDPITMDCVNRVPGPKDQVVNVIQTGYKLHDKILRPAKVEVGQGETDKPNNPLTYKLPTN